MIPDNTRPISMFRMKISEVFDPCSTLQDDCPCKPVYDANLNIPPRETRYLQVPMKDFHQIQLGKIDKYFHSGVDAPRGEGAFVVQNVDSDIWRRQQRYAQVCITREQYRSPPTNNHDSCGRSCLRQ